MKSVFFEITKDICITYGVNEMEYEIVSSFHSLRQSLREKLTENHLNLMHVMSKYRIERNVYIVGGYSTHPYELVTTFPLGKFVQ